VAVGRLTRFAIEDARQVIGIFAAICGIELVAAAVALLAAALLAPIGYLPVVGLLVLPLQGAVWLVRALLFESLSLASVAAYQTQYRRFAGKRTGDGVTGASETDAAPVGEVAE
jgi:membrane protein implicated in regulation of membrane protease activity